MILILCVCANIIHFLSSKFKLVCLWIVNVQIIFELMCILFKYYLSIYFLFSVHDIYIAFISLTLCFADTCTHSVPIFIICASLRLIYINCKANSISYKAQLRKVKNAKAMTWYQMTNSHASDTCWEDGDCGTTFYLNLHICSYLICVNARNVTPIGFSARNVTPLGFSAGNVTSYDDVSIRRDFEYWTVLLTLFFNDIKLPWA